MTASQPALWNMKQKKKGNKKFKLNTFDVNSKWMTIIFSPAMDKTNDIQLIADVWHTFDLQAPHDAKRKNDPFI